MRWRSPQDLKPTSGRRAIGETEPRIVQMVDIQPHGVGQRDHSALARKAVHACADGGIAVAAFVAELRALREGNGGSDLMTCWILSPYGGLRTEDDLGEQVIGLLSQVHGAVAGVEAIQLI